MAAGRMWCGLRQQAGEGVDVAGVGATASAQNSQTMVPTQIDHGLGKTRRFLPDQIFLTIKYFGTEGSGVGEQADHSLSDQR